MGCRRQDHLARKAKSEGYPARSVYKIEEIDRRLRLVRRGMRVLDLGAAPGSWAIYLGRAVGPRGSVVAVDPGEFAVGLPVNVRILSGSVEDLRDEIRCAGPFDLVVSDMAPSTIGDRGTDQIRSYELFVTALDVAMETTPPGAAFAGKIFQGPAFEEARGRVRDAYETVRVIRPRAVRSESYEIFLVGLGRLG